MISFLDGYKNVVILDFEFISHDDGNHVTPICYTYQELHSGKIVKHWIDGIETGPKYPIGDDTLVVAYASNAEMSCHASLGWKAPVNILDLYAEYLWYKNGAAEVPRGKGLVDACFCFGVLGADAGFKSVMRERILEGPPYSAQEQADILDYCYHDVHLTTKLLLKMIPVIENPMQAIIRGNFVGETAFIEYRGTPLDTVMLQKFNDNFEYLKQTLIEKINPIYHCYEGTVLKDERLKQYAAEQKIPWRLTSQGRLVMEKDYFKKLSERYPQLQLLYNTKTVFGQLTHSDLVVGKDGRNRLWLNPLGSKTQRNQPSSTGYIFGNPPFMRFLIKPVEGTGLAYCDYKSQEIAIAAWLSGDKRLQQACLSGDPYMELAIVAGAAPKGATKKTHGAIRSIFKGLMLGTNYGQGADAFAEIAGISKVRARAILQTHKNYFHRYWQWIENFKDYTMETHYAYTPLGWRICTDNQSRRSMQNWPMQSTGTDILHVAVLLLRENNIKVCATVHDAVLIESGIDTIDIDTRKTQLIMAEAANQVIGYPIAADAQIVKYPDHFVEDRGTTMWNLVQELLRDRE